VQMFAGRLGSVPSSKLDALETIVGLANDNAKSLALIETTTPHAWSPMSTLARADWKDSPTRRRTRPMHGETVEH
jgi:hypothetical protein